MEANPDAQPLAETDKNQALAAMRAIRATETNEQPTKTAEQVEQEAREIASATPTDTQDEPSTPAAPQLTADQQIKLRVRQEAQRIRAAAQQKMLEAEKRAQELEQQQSRFTAEKTEYERKMAELEALRKKAREAPKDFLTEAGTSLEDVVRAELEDGKPDARLTNLERMLEQQNRMYAELKQTLEAKERAEAEAKTRQTEEARIQQVKQEQENAERQFLKEAMEAKDYGTVSHLAKNDPIFALSLAYAANSKFKVEHGRDPSMQEIMATIEKSFGQRSGETEEVSKTGMKRKGAPTTTPGATGAPKSLEDLTDAQRKAEAVKAMRQIRQSEKVKV